MTQSRILLAATIALGLLSGQGRAAVLVQNITSEVQSSHLGAPIDFGDMTSSTALTGTGFGGVYESGMWVPYFLGYDSVYGSTDVATVVQAQISALSGATINSATLEWQFLDYNSGVLQQRISTFATNGTVGGTGAAITGVPNGGTIDTSVFSTNAGFNQVDITSMVQQRVAAGASWLGLYLEPIGNTRQFTYVGDDLGRAQVVLRVDYTPALHSNPEPATLLTWSALGLCATAGAVLKRRKNSQAKCRAS